ncbi:unnamed protein product [Heligmosomoides polygyrus]|uniref:TPR_REGION domain-containing protein n=1 Tax=Heligmosomoides polygyrus TaxID=6339 RepID=A0A183G766_HELPZ|nr:unnamed protein product [Heligmosomoides polygyrus]
MGSDKVEEAYKTLKQRYESDKSVEVLWRLARASIEVGDMQKSRQKRKDFVQEARTYALGAVAQNPNDYNAVRWAAITTGYNSEFLAAKEKIVECQKSLDYTDKGLQMKPNDHVLLYVKGRAMFLFCGLNSIEKRAMTVVFKQSGNEPPPSVDKALSIFLQAYNIQPKYVPTLLYIGYCLISLGDKKTAQKYLREATNLDVHGCDLAVQKECAELLKQC